MKEDQKHTDQHLNITPSISTLTVTVATKLISSASTHITRSNRETTLPPKKKREASVGAIFCNKPFSRIFHSPSVHFNATTFRVV